MPSTTRYKRGDIVLVPFPFTDFSSSKKKTRVLSSPPDWFSSSNQDLVPVAITSQNGDDPRSVLMDETDFLGGKLPKRSMVSERIYNPLGANRKANLRNNRVKIGRDFEGHPRFYSLTLSECPQQRISGI